MSKENFDKMITAVSNAICYIAEQETQGGTDNFKYVDNAVNALSMLLEAKAKYGTD